jgi:hypothetical protein
MPPAGRLPARGPVLVDDLAAFTAARYPGGAAAILWQAGRIWPLTRPPAPASWPGHRADGTLTRLAKLTVFFTSRGLALPGDEARRHGCPAALLCCHPAGLARVVTAFSARARRAGPCPPAGRRPPATSP